jgi:hypothetical protein
MRITVHTLTSESLMLKFDQAMRGFGYRPLVKEDLVPGAEFLMVEVARFMEPHNQTMDPKVTQTKIKLDDEPIKPSNAEPTKEIVFYHCIMPSWDGQCFVSIDDFTASGHRAGCNTNDTRYVVKSR